MDISEISQALGHSSIKQTKAYFKKFDNDRMKKLQENAMKI